MCDQSNLLLMTIDDVKKNIYITSIRDKIHKLMKLRGERDNWNDNVEEFGRTPIWVSPKEDSYKHDFLTMSLEDLKKIDWQLKIEIEVLEMRLEKAIKEMRPIDMYASMMDFCFQSMIEVKLLEHMLDNDIDIELFD